MRRVLVAAMLLLALSLAGCTVAVETGSGPTGTADARTATVVEVVDGDTVDVRFASGETDTVRLLGVDTPEPRGEVSPEEYGVADTEAGRACLREAADAATRFARERLAGREVRVETDPAADRRGSYGRLLAYVTLPGADRSFNRALLDAGHARVYVSDFSRLSAFRDAAAAARDADRGFWACP